MQANNIVFGTNSTNINYQAPKRLKKIDSSTGTSTALKSSLLTPDSQNERQPSLDKFSPQTDKKSLKNHAVLYAFLAKHKQNRDTSVPEKLLSPSKTNLHMLYQELQKHKLNRNDLQPLNEKALVSPKATFVKFKRTTGE